MVSIVVLVLLESQLVKLYVVRGLTFRLAFPCHAEAAQLVVIFSHQARWLLDCLEISDGFVSFYHIVKITGRWSFLDAISGLNYCSCKHFR